MSAGYKSICRVQIEFFRAILLVMSAAQIIAGLKHSNDCPKQPYIPIYLVIMGFIFLLLAVFSMPSPDGFEKVNKICGYIVSVFFFCWFIAGNLWIYSIYEPNYNTTTNSTATYCDKTLYQFAFWSTNLNYILLVFMFLCTCCTCLFCGTK